MTNAQVVETPVLVNNSPKFRNTITHASLLLMKLLLGSNLLQVSRPLQQPSVVFTRRPPVRENVPEAF